MNDAEKKVLAILAANHRGGNEFLFCSFSSLGSETNLERKVVRRACRSLARKGYARFASGLWTEDGEPAGSGYGATHDGLKAAALLPRPCQYCERTWIEPPAEQCEECSAVFQRARTANAATINHG